MNLVSQDLPRSTQIPSKDYTEGFKKFARDTSVWFQGRGIVLVGYSTWVCCLVQSQPERQDGPTRNIPSKFDECSPRPQKFGELCCPEWNECSLAHARMSVGKKRS